MPYMSPEMAAGGWASAEAVQDVAFSHAAQSEMCRSCSLLEKVMCEVVSDESTERAFESQYFFP